MNAPSKRQLTVLPLIAATFFMVSGGPYGLEELIQKAGYTVALAILIITPLIWSLPTALMIGELATMMPEEGGYYVWVRRAFGPFWGFQEAWLSLMASVFDMAIYPTLFVDYLQRLWHPAHDPLIGWLIKVAVVAVCAWLNIRGVKAVGYSSVVMTVLLLAPFGVLTLFALLHAAPAAARSTAHSGDWIGGILIAMWNYMGWDNASTIAGEVERPQRTYPLAMMGAVTLVTVCYLIPVFAVSHTALDPSAWETGSWVTAGGALAGQALAVAIVGGGMICGFAMFNALLLSNSRVPVVLAEDRFLPHALTRTTARSGAPWVAILVCSVAYAACLWLPFDRLVAIDVLVYGLSLLLEFLALIALRKRAPEMARPFRVPGGMFGAVLVAVGPTALLSLALIYDRGERAGPISALALALLVIGAGPFVYAMSRLWRGSRAHTAGAA